MIFPATVATLTYFYNSDLPIDRTPLQPMILSAETRKLMDKEEMWRAYNKTMTPAPTKKQSGFNSIYHISQSGSRLGSNLYVINFQLFKKI